MNEVETQDYLDLEEALNKIEEISYELKTIIFSAKKTIKKHKELSKLKTRISTDKDVRSLDIEEAMEDDKQKEYRRKYPSKRLEYSYWPDKEPYEWNNNDIIGYYLNKYLEYYEEEDHLFKRSQRRPTTVTRNLNGFLKQFDIDGEEIKNYIDWIFDNLDKKVFKWLETNITTNLIFGTNLYPRYLNRGKIKRRVATIGESIEDWKGTPEYEAYMKKQKRKEQW